MTGTRAILARRRSGSGTSPSPLRDRARLVHVDIERLHAVLDLASARPPAPPVVARLDQPAKFRRPRNIRPLPDIDKRRRRAGVVITPILHARG